MYSEAQLQIIQQAESTFTTVHKNLGIDIFVMFGTLGLVGLDLNQSPAAEFVDSLHGEVILCNK